MCERGRGSVVSVRGERPPTSTRVQSMYMPTKASGYLHESADASVWLINRIVGLFAT
jgi:hypothetical protein